MLLKSTCIIGLTILTSVLAFEQHPIGPQKIDLVQNIIDAFTPVVEISAFWENVTADVGNSLDAQELQHQPDILLSQWLDAEVAEKHKHTQITLALTDPDAPSHDNNTWSQVCHWLVTHVPYDEGASALQHYEKQSKKHFRDIVEYKPPGPPPKTGAHRYILVALAPINGTTKKLHLRTPEERFRWGYKQAGAGVREYAVEHGLGVIGANFFYSQNQKQ